MSRHFCQVRPIWADSLLEFH